MSIDFFKQGKHFQSCIAKFGLCDDSSQGMKSPAYLDESDDQKWIAEVINSQLIMIDFYALDCCIQWTLSNGDQAKVCDGLVLYNERKYLSFVELKDRNVQNKVWRERAEEQLASTIRCFKQNHGTTGTTLRAYVCNKQLLFDDTNDEFAQSFKDKVGATLRYNRVILIR